MRVSKLWPPLALLAAGGGCAGTPPPPVTWAQIIGQPAPPPGTRIAYGADSLQFGELRLPEGTGPHPLVVVIHGGCWQSAYGVDHVRPLAAALTREGYATWAIEYRRLGDPGGGWPGTFEDADAALAHVRVLAAAHPLDPDRTVLLGHSAGGHLALWLASRANLPAASAFSAPAAPQVRGVVALAAITDLVRYGEGEGSCNASVHPLMGGKLDDVPERYVQVDPVRLVPPASPVRLVIGAVDPIVPRAQAETYEAWASRAGADVKIVSVPGAGHFDVIAPFAPAWHSVRNAVRALAAAR